MESKFDMSISNNGLKVAVSILTVVSSILLMVLVWCTVQHNKAKAEEQEAMAKDAERAA